MLTLIIILFIAYGAYAGARKGAVLQGIMFAGYVVVFLLAKLLAGVFKSTFELWIPYPSATMSSHFAFFSQSLGLRLDDPFYLAFSFMFVFAIGWVIVRVVSLLLHELEYYPLPAKQNHWIGGVIGGLGAYLFVVMVLYLVAMIPVSGLQTALEHSLLAKIMVPHTPIFSWLLHAWWIG